MSALRTILRFLSRSRRPACAARIAAIAALAFPGCETPNRADPDDRPPAHEIAVIRVRGGHLVALDGEPREGKRLEVLPGRVDLQTRFVLSGEELGPRVADHYRATLLCRNQFQVEAGHRYAVTHVLEKSRRKGSATRYLHQARVRDEDSAEDLYTAANCWWK